MPKSRPFQLILTAVALLIKDSYLFNNPRVAPRQHRQGGITLFIGSFCCKVNNVCYKKNKVLFCPGSKRGRRFMGSSKDNHSNTHACWHISNLPVPCYIFSFQVHSLHYTVAFLCALLSAGTLQCFSKEATFIARSVSKPAGEKRIEMLELLYPSALLNICSIAQPSVTLTRYCGGITEELTLQLSLNTLLRSSSLNVWQVRVLRADFFLCSKSYNKRLPLNVGIRCCFLHQHLHFHDMHWGDMTPNLVTATNSSLFTSGCFSLLLYAPLLWITAVL